MGKRTKLTISVSLSLSLILCLMLSVSLLSVASAQDNSVSFALFDNSALTVPLSSLEWGDHLGAGLNYTCDLYVLNNGSVPINAFNVAMSQIEPPNATNYLGLVLKCVGNLTDVLPLTPTNSAELALTLCISQNAPMGNFSFQIVISALQGGAPKLTSSNEPPAQNDSATGAGGAGWYSQSLPMSHASSASTSSASFSMSDALPIIVVVAVCAYLFVATGRKR